MKAYTLYQPWASLWLTDRKIHETRPKQLHYRGWLAVHAGKAFVTDYHELGAELVEILHAEFGSRWPGTLPTGGIIGAVNVTDCISMKAASPAHDDDRICGNWQPKRYAIRRTDVIKLATPIPCRGYQFAFDVPDAIAAQILDPTKAAA